MTFFDVLFIITVNQTSECKKPGIVSLQCQTSGKCSMKQTESTTMLFLAEADPSTVLGDSAIKTDSDRDAWMTLTKLWLKFSVEYEVKVDPADMCFCHIWNAKVRYNMKGRKLLKDHTKYASLNGISSAPWGRIAFLCTLTPFNCWLLLCQMCDRANQPLDPIPFFCFCFCSFVCFHIALFCFVLMFVCLNFSQEQL